MSFCILFPPTIHAKAIEPKKSAPEKIAYLTFDDGPSANTIAILDILDQYEIKATFFVIGKEGSFASQNFKEIIQRKHAIALHSYTHDYEMIYQSKQQFFEDLKQLENMLFENFKVKTKLIRFPGGSKNMALRQSSKKMIRDEIISELQAKGYTYFDWNVDSTDGYSPTVREQTIVKAVLNGAENQTEAIILLHDISEMKNTVKALPVIIEGLKKQGFQFKVLSEKTKTVHF
jgi:peptidoglycan-N-acetylglucosamine deacetylase